MDAHANQMFNLYAKPETFARICRALHECEPYAEPKNVFSLQAGFTIKKHTIAKLHTHYYKDRYTTNISSSGHTWHKYKA